MGWKKIEDNGATIVIIAHATACTNTTSVVTTLHAAESKHDILYSEREHKHTTNILCILGLHLEMAVVHVNENGEVVRRETSKRFKEESI